MSKISKWIIRGMGFLLATGATLYACGCSPCSIGIPCKTGCPLSPKNILEAVVMANLFD